MYYKLGQLFLTPGQKAGTTSEVYISQPDSIKENLVGRLFLLLEIDSKEPGILKFINFLISELNRNYYQNDKAILKERVSTIKIEQIFESAIAKTNKNLAEYFQSVGININPTSINATAGIIFENQLHFSLVGKNRSFLLYKNKKDQEENYRITEISKGNEIVDLNSSKFFPTVISGTMPEDGFFLFTNETLPEYLTQKQLTEIITTLPPANAAEQMKQHLTNINAYVTFLAIIVKNTLNPKNQEPRKIILPPSTAQASIANLKVTEQSTEKLLAPSGMIDLPGILNALKQRFSSDDGRSRSPLLITEKLSFGKRSNFILIKRAAGNLKNVASFAVSFLLRMPETVKQIKFDMTFFKRLGRGRNLWKNVYGWFDSLGMKNKVLIGMAVIFLILFFQNSLFMNFKNKKQERLQFHNELISQIEQKENQVESNLIFKNDEGARKLMSEIRGLLEQLPKDNPQYSILSERFLQQDAKVNHSRKVEMIELANLKNLKEAADSDSLAKVDGNLFADDGPNRSIYKIDIAGKTATVLDVFPANSSSLGFPISQGSDIYYFDDSKFVIFNTIDEKFTDKALDFSKSKGSLAGASLYNDKLYLLSRQDNQIYRFNNSPDRFSGESAWLKNPTDLSNAQSFAIDGSIYLVRSNGQIERYLKGAKEDFFPDQIEPAITEPKKIAVSSKHIIISEPKNRRMLVFDKKGKLTNQLYSEKLDSINDFLIDEASNQLFILNNNIIYQISL